MKLSKQAVALAVAGMISTSSAWAVSFGDGGAAVQAVLDSIAVDASNDVTAATDYLPGNSDAYWSIGGTGGSISTIVVELGSYASENIFGVYDPISGGAVDLFSGSAGVGSQALLSILADGSVYKNFVDTGVNFAGNSFTFYLRRDVVDPAIFYSDTNLNADGFDHMAAYQGVGEQVQILPYAAGPWATNEYVLAWEDLTGGGDGDYDDFVVMVESVTPIPVPATLALMGLGLMGLGYSARRNKKNA